MTSKRAILNRVLILSPWLTVALLMGMAVLLPNRSEFSPDSVDRKAEIAAAIKAVPMFIGRWVGQDVDVPREAQTLLRPNAILSRSYSSPGEPAVRVLVVHCGDARDMIGHYPPVCYPSSGWKEIEAEQEQAAIVVADRPASAQQYCFRFIGERGAQTIRVFNMFILPDGTITGRIEHINRQSERLAISAQGVAQLQIITSATAPLEQAVAAANEILVGLAPMFEAFGVHGKGVRP